MSKPKLLITGHNSMIGKHILYRLNLQKYIVVGASKHEYDLTVQDKTIELFDKHRPDYVIHLAGYNGGIEFNRRFGDKIYEQTARMALNVLSCCRDFKVKKCLSVLASCSYPNSASEIPMVESDLWNGAPNSSVECHGSAKRILDVYGREISKTGFLCTSVIMNNSFGPFDRFDPLRGKVVSALIKKFVEAQTNNLPEVVCWGTGAPLREFIYADDAAACILEVMENYHEPEPINISSGQEISIKQLTEMIAEITGYTGKILWDSSKPDGQMRKALDLTKMNKYVTHTMTDIKQALTNTIEWYKNHMKDME